MNAMKSRFAQVLAILFAVATICHGVAVPAYADQSTTENHYLGFASDLHDTSGTLEGAFGNFPNDPEYVSLVGDMVGARGGDAPAFNTSDILNRIRAIDTCGNIAADGSNASIVWADHDSGVTDDAGIMKGMGDPAGYTSGQIYEGKNEDGSTAYYVYVIGFYHMLNGGNVSQQAAETFKSWAADKDVTVPIIVLCHAPLVAKRGDNNGATYWSEALNYAATGKGGITTEDQTDIPLIRDVIFLSGHNHTVDPNEYVYEVGSVMNVQVDTTSGTLSAGQDGSTVTESYDEEVADLLGSGSQTPNVTATGTNTRVYFTALTPGYLKTSGNGTLITIAKDTITFDKYNESGQTNLGVAADGTSVSSPLVLKRVAWGEPTYIWSDDLSSVTATRALVDNPNYTESETVATSKAVSREATCTEKGETTYTAVFANDAFEPQTKTREDIDALGHNWGEWIVTKEATDTEEGIETRVCSRCGEVETRKTPKLSPGQIQEKSVASSKTAKPQTALPNTDDPSYRAVLLTQLALVSSLLALLIRKRTAANSIDR